MISTLCSNLFVIRAAFIESLRVSDDAGPLKSECLRFGMLGDCDTINLVQKYESRKGVVQTAFLNVGSGPDFFFSGADHLPSLSASSVTANHFLQRVLG